MIRGLLGLRYRVQLDGLEQLSALRGPTLVLPNHPAYIDPLLLIARVDTYRPLRPLVYSGTYRMKMLWPLMRLTDAFEVPDLTLPSRENQLQTRQMIEHIVQRLQAGDCILLYPSGRLQRGDREVVGAASAAFEVISRVPTASIVLVRTRGLWGSRFSCAATGQLPDLPRQAQRAALWTLASLFFWLPRRHVTVQFQVIERSQLPLNDRRSLNEFLERWYNADGGQPPKFVRYHRWFGPRQGNYQSAIQPTIDLTAIQLRTIQQVNQIVEELLGRPLTPSEQQPETDLESFGFDSLDRVELTLRIQEQFQVRQQLVPETLGGLWRYAESR
ncbi:MAG: 1-acyl-sn-glycerol-3-phosphate acyltransferase [Pirellulaceae bacterium]|nr:1-acyl-sn-glycerol-3-phosphate acyltransferase [Pirellulaceae bacterium]